MSSHLSTSHLILWESILSHLRTHFTRLTAIISSNPPSPPTSQYVIPTKNLTQFPKTPGSFRFRLVFDFSFALSLSRGRPFVVSLSKGHPFVVSLSKGRPFALSLSKGRPFVVSLSNHERTTLVTPNNERPCPKTHQA